MSITSRIRLALRFINVAVVSVGILACENETAAPRGAPVAALARAWKRAMPAVQDREISSNALAESGQYIFVASNRAMSAVSATTGDIEWSAEGSRSSAVSIGATTDLAIVPSGSRLLALAKSSGQLRWQTEVGIDVDGCVGSIAATLIVACTPAWQVTALDPVTGSVRWSVNLRDSLSGLPTLVATVISGDTVYAVVKQIYSTTVGFAQALIFALSARDGSILSLMRVGDYTDFVGYVGTPTVVGRMLVLPHLFTNRLTGIDRFTGRIAWRLNGDPGWAGFIEVPTVVDGIVYAASADRRVYAVDAATGSVKWKSDILEGSQLIASACGAVVITWSGVNVRILDRSTGKYLGIIEDEIPDLSYGITSPPLTNGNELFVRSQKEYRKYICP
jgi:eukaryotic-like serine/threonine-protein kinase